MSTEINDLIHTTSHYAFESGKRTSRYEIIREIESMIKANKAYEQFGLRVLYKEQVLQEVLDAIKNV